MGPIGKNQQDMKQEDALGSIEGKDWSPSYLRLGSFVRFFKFCNRSYSAKTHSQASGINIEPQLL
jgi:hypothetical protein